jgi:hypothetical protein
MKLKYNLIFTRISKRKLNAFFTEIDTKNDTSYNCGNSSGNYSFSLLFIFNKTTNKKTYSIDC